MSIWKMSTLCAALLIAAPWVNATTAQVALENLRFSVVDLDPGDGVDPSFTFLYGPNVGFGRVARSCMAGTCNNSGGYAQGLFEPAASSFALDGASGHGEVTDGRIMATASASQLGNVAFGGAGVTVYAFLDQVENPSGLLLGSNSRLIVSADYSFSLQAQSPGGPDALDDVSSAQVWLDGFVQYNEGFRETGVDAQVFAGPGEPASVSFESGSLTLQLDNTFFAPRLVYLDAWVGAGADSRFKSPEPPPIPEPSTAVLMGAGLLVAGAARRRWHQARPGTGPAGHLRHGSPGMA